MKKLGDVCKTIQDGAHQSPQKQFDTPGEGRFLYITSKNIRTNYLDLSNVTYVERDFHDQIYPRCQPQVGDVLLTKDGANTGNVTLNTIDEPFSLLSSVCLIKTDPTVLKPEFLCYYLQSPIGLRRIVGEMTGAAIKRIVLRDIKLATISLPSLPEQQRIVGILDKVFNGIATVKANAEKNIENARALFERYRQEVFTSQNKEWIKRTLDDVTELITCGVAKRPKYVESGVPFLSAKNVKNGRIIWGGYQYVSEETHHALTKHNKPKLGDILYTRVGSYGEAAIIDREIEFSIFVSLTLIKPKPILLNTFLKHYLNSSVIKQLAARSINGVGVGNLNVGAVREFPICLPPITEQRSIAASLDALRTEIQSLETIYKQKLAALDELKKSLLHKAFTGEL